MLQRLPVRLRWKEPFSHTMKGTHRIQNLRTPALQHPLIPQANPVQWIHLPQADHIRADINLVPQALKPFPALAPLLLPAPALTIAVDVATTMALAPVPAPVTAVVTAVAPVPVPALAAAVTAIILAPARTPVRAQMTAVIVIIAAVVGNVETLRAGTLQDLFRWKRSFFGFHQACYHDSYESSKMVE